MKEYKGLHRDLIDKRLQIDCAMSVAAILATKDGSPPCTLIGSWTVFNIKNSDVGTCKFETGFLPVITQPPKDDVCQFLPVITQPSKDDVCKFLPVITQPPKDDVCKCLPVINQPPKDDVYKCYLDFLLNTKSDRNLSNIFCHIDHDVFFKLSQITWIEKMKA